MPVFDMTEENFMDLELEVFRFGLPPSRINLMTSVKGLAFDETYKHSTLYDDNGLKIRLVHINDLIMTKKASGRPRDVDDIDNLNNRHKNS